LILISKGILLNNDKITEIVMTVFSF